MSKKLLEESTIRQFMKLAELQPLASSFLESVEEAVVPAVEEEALEESKQELTEEVLEEDSLEEGYADEAVAEMSYDSPMEEQAIEEMMNDMDMEEGAHEDAEMEAEAGDMEAEINITPDQARAIIAVADMLKDIMPDLDAPEMEDEEEMDMAADDEMAADDDEADADAEMDDADEKEDDADDEEEEVDMDMAADDLAESIMKRVQARLQEMKSN
jgi:hypothetical protein